MKLWMPTEIPGEAAGASALVWADDPDEARRLLQEKAGRQARVCREVYAPGSTCIDSLSAVHVVAMP